MAIAVSDEHRNAVRSRLMDAMGKREVHLLRAAIQEGIKVSVASDVLECAAQVLRQEESVLIAGQRRAAAEAELRQAAASSQVERLRAAIEIGRISGVKVDILNDAAQILAREEGKAFARQALRTAIANNVPSALMLAIEQAKAAGLQQELSEAIAVLAQQKQTMVAQTRLQAAIQTPELIELRAAIEAGKKEMVSQSLLDCALVILQNIQKRGSTAETRATVQKDLEEAMRVPQLESLRSLIERAKEVDVEISIINSAYVVMSQEEQKEHAVDTLTIAVASKDMSAIRSALHVAQSLQVPECRLTTAKATLTQEDRRIAAQSKLEQAAVSSEPSVLRVAIDEAKEAGVDPKVIDSAGSALIRLEELQAARSEAQSKLEEAMSHPTVEGLQAAIDNGKCAGVAIDILNSALRALGEEKCRVASRAEVHKIVKHVCPTCQASFRSSEEVRAHWSAVHGATSSVGVKEETCGVCKAEKQPPSTSANAPTETENKRVKQICPTCRASFTTLEAVRAHWLAAHGSGSSAGVSSETEGSDSPESQATTTAEARTKQVKQICPTCYASFTSMEEVRAHWLEVHGPISKTGLGAGRAADAGAQPNGESPAAAADPAEANGKPSETQCEPMEVVACDDEGKPVVMRRVENETGVAKTVVLNSDGTQRVFGETTVLSMATSDEAKVSEWIDCMTDLQLRGLVHEVTKRVVEGSERYHSKHRDLKQLSEKLNLQFFGLPAEANERELDNAYRKFARNMHPDKNGGTEEAKEKFQNMKTRYEALKKHFSEAQQQSAKEEAPSGSSGDSVDAASKREAGEADDLEEKKRSMDASNAKSDGQGRREAYEEDEEQEVEEPTSEKMECDFRSRDSLEEMAWKMLRQMKAIKQNMDIIDGQLQSFSKTKC